MIGVDTNALVRLLTHDDVQQAKAARRYVERHSSPDGPIFINRVVIVELVWVLESAYSEYGREQIADALETLLNTAAFTVEDHSSIRSAVKAYRSGADFLDALISIENHGRGCTATVTFDSAAAKILPHLTLID